MIPSSPTTSVFCIICRILEVHIESFLFLMVCCLPVVRCYSSSTSMQHSLPFLGVDNSFNAQPVLSTSSHTSLCLFSSKSLLFGRCQEEELLLMTYYIDLYHPSCSASLSLLRYCLYGILSCSSDGSTCTYDDHLCLVLGILICLWSVYLCIVKQQGFLKSLDRASFPRCWRLGWNTCLLINTNLRHCQRPSNNISITR